MTKISINQKECIGCAFCESCAPEIFKFDEKELKGKVKYGELSDACNLELSAEQLQKAKEAQEGCAPQAIKVEET